MKAVTFRYPRTAPASGLKSLNLTAGIGERIAIVGPTGAGKSTLFQLLLRHYDIQAGAIQINGVDIRNLALPALRGLLGYVPQESVVFAASALDNIRYGRWQADEADIIAAAKAAHAHDFIAALPEGYHTQIGERGVTLSGGQRQKLAVARVILKNAPVLLLDEATSALDAQSEYDIQRSLEKHMEGRTSLIIAHRLATVRDADRIVVMDDGHIIASGTHDKLVAQGGLYARLSKLQFRDMPPGQQNANSVTQTKQTTAPIA